MFQKLKSIIFPETTEHREHRVSGVKDDFEFNMLVREEKERTKEEFDKIVKKYKLR